MFGESMGTEISWLLPAALIGLVAGLWLTLRAPRTDRTRAALVLWGGWLLVTAVVFSFMQGTMHPYYTIALSPAIAALIGISVCELWIRRTHIAARLVLAAMVVSAGIWGFVLLDRTPQWYPALRWIVLAGTVLAALALIVRTARPGKLTAAVAIAAVLFSFTGTTAYTLATVAIPHNGSIPTSGPNGGGGPGGFGGTPPGLDGSRHGLTPPAGLTPPGGATAPTGSAPSNGGSALGGSDGQASQEDSADDPNGSPGGFSGSDVSSNADLQKLLRTAGTHWAAATIGSMSAAPLELSTGSSVMAIGGFTGSDDSPTLAQFQQYVTDGKIRYFIPGGMGGGPGGGSDSTSGSITTWVKAHYTTITVGGTTVYDLTAPVGK